MPTGYTAILEERDVSFNEFALRCARNFGALIMLRDESIDKPLPQQLEPSNFYQERIEEVEAELAKFLSYGDWDIQELYQKEQAYVLSRNKESKEKADILRGRITALIRDVENWEYPTEDHKRLKEFMLEQLEITLKHDAVPYEQEFPYESSEEWKNYTIDRLRGEIAYFKEHHQLELGRTAQRNKWLQDLRASLP